jgi:hypothetical protein
VGVLVGKVLNHNIDSFFWLCNYQAVRLSNTVLCGPLRREMTQFGLLHDRTAQFNPIIDYFTLRRRFAKLAKLIKSLMLGGSESGSEAHAIQVVAVWLQDANSVAPRLPDSLDTRQLFGK